MLLDLDLLGFGQDAELQADRFVGGEVASQGGVAQ
jgi:hypothetical protein